MREIDSARERERESAGKMRTRGVCIASNEDKRSVWIVLNNQNTLHGICKTLSLALARSACLSIVAARLRAVSSAIQEIWEKNLNS